MHEGFLVLCNTFGPQYRHCLNFILKFELKKHKACMLLKCNSYQPYIYNSKSLVICLLFKLYLMYVKDLEKHGRKGPCLFPKEN